MATTAKIVRELKKPKFEVRSHHRCSICGRGKAYIRKFGLCRICFRQLAHKGELPGVIKASW